jgi:hypothetical protein
MPEDDSHDASVPHKLEHISRIIRQKYPAGYVPCDTERGTAVPASVSNTAIVAATTIVLIATPAALYFLVSEKLLCSLAALVTALGAAFGPKIYADFIQPRRPPGPPTSVEGY